MDQVSFSIYNIISILTCFVGVFYAIQIAVLKKNASVDNRYFISYLLVLSSIVFLFFLIDLDFKIVWLNLTIVFFIIPLVLLSTPLMWLYIRKLTSYRQKRKTIIHFYPAIISSIIILITGGAFLVTKSRIFIDILSSLVTISLISVFLIQNVYYIYISIRSFKLYKKKVAEVYSYSEEVDLSWIKIMISGYIVFIVGIVIVNNIDSENKDKVNSIDSYSGKLKIELAQNIDLKTGDRITFEGVTDSIYKRHFKITKIDNKSFYISKLKFNSQLNIDNLYVISNDKFVSSITNIFFSLIIFLYIIYTGHNALKQKGISFLEPEDQPEIDEEIKDKILPEGQSVVFQKIKEELLEIMKTEKPYLDQDLNIFSLAKRLNTNSKYLSQVINQEFNKSFVHFVNEYRIEDAKQILLTKNNYTIEAQSQMVGFKSKSSFNIAFKRHTGLTPSLFIQENR